MRRLMTAGLAAALSVSLAPLVTAQTAPAVVGDDAHMTAALGLARIVNEVNGIEAQAERLLVSIAVQGFANDPDLAALKAEYPGVEKLFLDTLRPILMDELALMLPGYNRAVGEFFAANFTTAEIGELAAFWRSDAGQTLLTSVASNLDLAESSKEIVTQMDGDTIVEISEHALLADKRAAAVKGARDLTPQQRVAVMRFGLTTTGRKMARLADKKNAIDREWANRDLSSATKERIDRELGEALIAHIEAQENARAAER